MVYALDIEKAFPPAKNFGDFGKLLDIVFPLVIIIGGLIFFAMMIVGVFRIISAAQYPEKVQSAQKTFGMAWVGLAIVLAAYVIVRLVQYIFAIPNHIFQ